MVKLVYYIRKNVSAKGDAMNFIRMVRYLKSMGDASTEMYCINGEEVDLGSENLDIKDRFIPFTDEYSDIFMDSVFLVNINHVFFFAEEISRLNSLPKMNARVCFLAMHPNCYSWFGNNQLLNPQRDIPKLFEKIKKHNAFAFMDEANRITANLVSGFEFEKYYIPTGYAVSEQDPKIKPAHDSVRIGWFGRIDTDKIASVINMLDNIYDYCASSGTIMTVYIIGDGNGRGRIRINKYSPLLRIVFTSYLYGNELKRFISNELDAVVAMGISAIDAAVLGVPTVIPIVSDRDFAANRFVYLKDTSGYSLAWTQDVLRCMDMPVITMHRLIADLENGKKEQIGGECRKCVIDNFNVAHCTELFKESVSHTSYYVSELLKTPLVKKTLKDYKRYKILTGRNDINIYFMFFKRKKRVLSQHGMARIQALYYELKKTRDNKHKKNNGEKK